MDSQIGRLVSVPACYAGRPGFDTLSRRGLFVLDHRRLEMFSNCCAGRLVYATHSTMLIDTPLRALTPRCTSEDGDLACSIPTTLKISLIIIITTLEMLDGVPTVDGVPRHVLDMRSLVSPLSRDEEARGERVFYPLRFSIRSAIMEDSGACAEQIAEDGSHCVGRPFSNNGINSSPIMTNGIGSALHEEDSDDNDAEFDYPGICSEDGKKTVEEFVGRQDCRCLGCQKVLENPESVITHMLAEHEFDLIKLCLSQKIDQISFVKLINYVRTNDQSLIELKAGKVLGEELDDSYMMPHTRDDAFLRFDMEGHLEYLRAEGIASNICSEGSDNYEIVETHSQVEAEREELRLIVHKQRDMLNRFASDMLEKSEFKKEEMVGMRTIEADAGYFDSYSNYEIHHEMLSDTVRTQAYREAILRNTALVSGKRVLDLGCGTAILSMFCAQAKAAAVHAIDMASVAFDAMEIVRTNKLDDIIQVTRGRLEDQAYPEKFDIIVSEWMGYFLLFEGMLDSVIYARDRFLAPGGIMMPNRCTLHIIAIDDKEMYAQYSQFWNNVYGFDMSCIARKWLQAASTITVREKTIATSTAQIAEFDLEKCSCADTQFTTAFSLTALRSTTLTAFAGYFDTHFDLPHVVSFSTGPHAKTTHWKQTVFLLPEPLNVTEGEVLNVSISVKRHPHDVRALEVNFKLPHKTLHYTVD
ncbi:S-adenosyl-L-methionine-dependent methyltransferase [Trinorchestia longiramus]|nr:S-adenosyl-L-methionine-dependent methyltransferase [Trinorchestia longiramus]